GSTDLSLPTADRAASAALSAGVHLEVPHLSRTAGCSDQRPPVDDQPAADADLTGDVDEMVDSHPGSPGVLGEGAEVRLVGDEHRQARPEPIGHEASQRDIS